MDLPAPLTDAVERLLDRYPERVSLDALADAIGTRAVTPPEIDEMMRRLEERGRIIEQPDAIDLPRLLRDVLGTARELRTEGEVASTRAIAARLDVPETSVHAALLFARTLSR